MKSAAGDLLCHFVAVLPDVGSLGCTVSARSSFMTERVVRVKHGFRFDRNLIAGFGI